MQLVDMIPGQRYPYQFDMKRETSWKDFQTIHAQNLQAREKSIANNLCNLSEDFETKELKK